VNCGDQTAVAQHLHRTPLPRLNAHRVVLAAAALTTLVAAALATTLVVFSDQALPHTVRQRLTAASGTSMIVARPIANTNAAAYTAGLAVLTAVAVVAETRLLRHRDVPGLLRIGG
jgi:hypothetical protein